MLLSSLSGLEPDQKVMALLMEDLLPALVIERPSWMAEAACRGEDTALFFIERGGSTTEAKALCAECPVKEPCLAYAIEHDLDGVWAGTTRRSRARSKTPGRHALPQIPCAAQRTAEREQAVEASLALARDIARRPGA